MKLGRKELVVELLCVIGEGGWIGLVGGTALERAVGGPDPDRGWGGLQAKRACAWAG